MPTTGAMPHHARLSSTAAIIAGPEHTSAPNLSLPAWPPARSRNTDRIEKSQHHPDEAMLSAKVTSAKSDCTRTGAQRLTPWWMRVHHPAAPTDQGLLGCMYLSNRRLSTCRKASGLHGAQADAVLLIS